MRAVKFGGIYYHRCVHILPVIFLLVSTICSEDLRSPTGLHSMDMTFELKHNGVVLRFHHYKPCCTTRPSWVHIHEFPVGDTKENCWLAVCVPFSLEQLLFNCPSKQITTMQLQLQQPIQAAISLKLAKNWH